uniref:RING-type domain-containing protein n=1 Tax=Hyaloperonospora arabidopsidis (strain Emoy2) TaxID=559515 RepID=M4BB82_HYAAE
MNGYVVPDHPPTTQAPKRPASKIYTLKELRQCTGSELPLRLSVSATKKEEGYAVYTITTSSLSTQNRCQASFRYSEFLAFRNQVEELWTCHDGRCQGSCQSLRDLIEACFPKKVGPMSTWSFMVEDRKNKFKNVLIHLLRSVLLPGSTMKCFHARQQLPPALFKFLGVEDDADKRSLLQVYVDNHQSGMKKSSSHSSLSSLEAAATKTSMVKSATTPNLAQMELDAEEKTAVVNQEEIKCMICLDVVEKEVHSAGPQGLVALPCKHAYHRECIFEWLLFQYHCPMCRAQVGPHAMTNYACPKMQEQWWLGNFKQNPLAE